MSHEWAERQRRTSRLIRALAGHVLKGDGPTTEQLYGFCKLTWITSSYDDEAASYIRSTKIPGIELVFGLNFEHLDLNSIGHELSQIVGHDITALVEAHTGFTNFYGAYRNSCADFLTENHDALSKIFRDAHELSNDSDGLEIVKVLQVLPGVPKPNTEGQQLHPENLITPVLFSLDERLRFPIINGNENVKRVLTRLGAVESPLTDQYTKMVTLIGSEFIDAAELDQAERTFPELEVKTETLPLKDESDVKAVAKSREVNQKRVHNQLTNLLREQLPSFKLLEGRDSSAMFDVMVENFDGNGSDLLIEAKSSIDAPLIRMAIGQLFDYWYRTKGPSKPDIAILTPSKPSEATIDLLNWLGIGSLWVANGKLRTDSERLALLCFPAE